MPSPISCHMEAASQPALISGYFGKSDKFDEAIADFSIAYADQSERDYALLISAVRKGRLPAMIEGPARQRKPEARSPKFERNPKFEDRKVIAPRY